MWCYEKFFGCIGKSDIVGIVEVVIGGKCLLLKGDLIFWLFDFVDFGLLIGV